MLQSSFFDPVLGVDIHIVLVPTPAGPVPTPVPMPFVGMVFDPVGLAMGAAIGMATGGGPGLVMINSLPVTNAGTNVTNKLTMPHLPVPGVAFAKGLPGNDAELFFGSLNVKLAGSLGVRLGDIAMSCSDPVRLPTSVVLAIPKGMPVLNMPAMVPDLAGIAQRLVMMGAMRLLRVVARGGARLFRALRAAQRRSSGWARVSRAVRSVTDRIAPQRYRDRLRRAVCFVTGHPVDVATGRVFTDNIDFELPGPLPLVFERVYSSSLSWRNGPLGYGWSHSLDQQVWLEPGKVVFLAEDGRETEFHTDGLPDCVIRPGQSLYDATNRLTLRALGDFRWAIESADGGVREFSLVPGDNSQRARLQRIQSRDGHHAIQLTYSSRGHLEWVRDCGGRLIAFVHDKQGRFTEVKLPLSQEPGFYRHLQYAYGANGDLVQVVDAAGHSWKFEYQGHLLVQETDRAGLSFYFQYDGLGSSARCVRTWGDGGIYDHLITYDGQNRKTVVEDSLGATIVYQMDDLGMVVKVVDPHGAATKYAYDEDCGELAGKTDALGYTRTTTYDKKGNVVRIRGTDGSNAHIEYDERGLPVRLTDALNNVWTWAYDLEGHLIKRVAPSGEKTLWGWRKGLPAWTEASGGRRVSLAHDEQKNLILIRDPKGGNTQYEYDKKGRVTRVRDARGASARFDYDVLGNLARVEPPSRVVQELAYDAQGNMVEVRDSNRHVRFHYGHFHKVLVREEAGTSLRFVYDTEGRLTGFTNEADETYTFTLDARGQVIEETGFDGRTCSYERNEIGQVKKVQRPSGRNSQLTYDAVGRVLTVKHSDGSATEFTYRADGALVSAKNESSVVLLERDTQGRVLREVQGDYAVSSIFDSHGDRTLKETSLGWRMAVLHDALGKVASIHAGGRAQYASRPVLNIERDTLGLEVAREVPGGIRVEWQRDVIGRPVSRRTLHYSVDRQAHQLNARTYEWRSEDQIAAISDTLQGSTRFVHDARGRLIAQQTSLRTLHRAMDAVGNIFRTSDRTDRAYKSGGRLEEADGTRYIHDEDGHLAEKVDADGGHWRYHWNGSGMLVSVERPDEKRVCFEYDAFARRTRKTVLHRGPDGVEQTKSDVRFVWDGHVVLHEIHRVYTPQEGGGAVATERITNWYWEPDSFTPVAVEENGFFWIITSDHLGTPSEIYDEQGQLAWRQQLDIFGSAKIFVLGTQHPCLEHFPWRWPGHYEDEETGLYYNRFRYYSPDTGRYIRQDPIGPGGGINLYAFVADPLVQTDFWGLSECIHFGQRRIGPQFQFVNSDAPDYIRGRLLTDVAEDIRAGKLSPDDIIVQYFRDPRSGLWVAANNRGLAAISLAGRSPTLTEEIIPTQAHLNRLWDPPLKGFPQLPSRVVPVTEGPNNTAVLYVVEII
ncbi:MAG TPA: DUF6531 domain-containing protein [Myxococcaceae bacterium]|nr:DUF6531 domain-containing protein [Myxococcaceae bacterium]